MGVIHILTPEYSPKVGGVADYTRQLAIGLAQAGEDVHVWCPGTGSDPVVHVHAELGAFLSADLERTGLLLDQFAAPRRLLVQWVPHGYGRRAMNVPFCFWLWRRAAGGDHIELMVHEPYLHLWEGSWRQTAAAVVHRFMTTVLLRSARRVWISVPAWESMWKPYTLGRAVPFAWLPIPSGVEEPDPAEVQKLRASIAAGREPIVGHLGTFGPHVTSLLGAALPSLLDRVRDLKVLLIGIGSEDFRSGFIARYPAHAGRVTATGTLPANRLAAHVAACDLLLQPYADGVTSRRTTVMAGLRLGVPVVTTRGYLTEKLWDETGAVRLADVHDVPALVDHVVELLASDGVRRQLRKAGRDLYDQVFDISRTIAALTRVEQGRAA